MPKALEKEATLVTIRLFEDDLKYLRLSYTQNYNSVVRALVARHVRKLRAKTVENLAEEQLTIEELGHV